MTYDNKYIIDLCLATVNDNFEKSVTEIKKIENELIYQKNSLFFNLFNKKNKLLLQRKQYISAFDKATDYVYNLVSTTNAKDYYNRYLKENCKGSYDIFKDKYAIDTAIEIIASCEETDCLAYGFNLDYLKMISYYPNDDNLAFVLFVDSFINQKKHDAISDYIASTQKIFEYINNSFNEEELEKVNVNLFFNGLQIVDISEDKKFINGIYSEFKLTQNPLLKRLYSYIFLSSDFDNVRCFLDRPSVDGINYITHEENKRLTEFKSLIKKYEKTIALLRNSKLENVEENFIILFNTVLMGNEKSVYDLASGIINTYSYNEECSEEIEEFDDEFINN